jgi:response regulator RpfG family c-di-GMP phosphodiesterase
MSDTATQPGDYSTCPILYVDDEPSNLLTFRFSLDNQFNVITARSGEEALEVLRKQPIAVLLADHRMDPGMSGTELCARAQDTSPDTVRMIVTAYGDFDIALQAINGGAVTKFIKKPWDLEHMSSVLVEGIELFQRAWLRRHGEPGGRSEATLPSYDLRRKLTDPTSVLLHNLDWSAKTLVSLDACTRSVPGLPETCHALRSAVQDSREAVNDLCLALEALGKGGSGVG